MNTVDYLEEVKKKHNIQSDYKLAEHLNITRSAISRYRNYDAHMDNFTCYKIAESLEINPHKVLIDIAMGKEKKEDKKEYWKKKLKQLSILPSIFFITIVLTNNSAIDNKEPLLQQVKISHNVELCKIIYFLSNCFIY